VRISLDDISLFIQCPRYYFLLKKESYVFPSSRRLSIIERMIARAYTRRTDYETKSEWRSIVGWVDKEVFKDVDIADEKAFEAARKLSESVLLFLQKWYEFDYIRSSAPAYVGIPVCYDFGDVIVESRVPLIQMEDVPVITYIDEIDYDELRIYTISKQWAGHRC
jgi:hypothetical protein